MKQRQGDSSTGDLGIRNRPMKSRSLRPRDVSTAALSAPFTVVLILSTWLTPFLGFLTGT